MDTSTIICIGSGNMGFALMNGIAAAGDGTRIGFTDLDDAKAKTAAAALNAVVYDSNRAAAAQGDYIFLAVKPQVMAEVLAEIAPVIRTRRTEGAAPALVSMAAGWSISAIQAAIGEKVPVARIMPNTPALIAQGMIALASSPELSEGQIAALEALLKGAGIVDRLDERYLNAVTALSGSGPAFVYLFIEALADGGVLAGLPRDKALRYAAQTVMGSAEMFMESGKHPGELKDMVCSPGGTTIAGIAALEAGSFRSTAIQAVKAAWQRSIELCP